MEPELKANAAEIVLRRIFALFRGKEFRGVVERFVRRNYNKGMMAREVALKLRTNPVPVEEKIDIMTDYTTTEIQGVLSELDKQIAQVIREGILANESPPSIRKKVKALLNPTEVSTFTYPSGRHMNWRDRINMIMRTESSRAQNIGHLDTFNQSGLSGRKYIDTAGEACKTICEVAAHKYNEKNAIPVDEEFVINDGKRTVRFNVPPLHPNCRCRVMFRIDEGENA